ncbi:MAG: hypothetical protein AAF657_35320 [Acidobacteriota bacterium]
MKKYSPEPIRKSGLAFLAAAFFLIVGVAVAVPPNPSAAGSGPWLNSNYTDECPVGKVCAEWPYDSSNIAMVCCIEPGDVDSYRFEDCDTYITHRVIN